MNSNTYHLSRAKKAGEVINLEINKLEGYLVNPKVREDDAISVNKILFTDSNISEKIIRKKIDGKIEYLLYKLNLSDNEDSGSGSIQKSLIDAEKLRMQLINKYIKYLGHTYYSLTLKKIELIIDELNYKLYMNEFKKENHYDNEKEGRRGR